jgi:alpha(1,3/1,4) fucosyltransferase
MKKLFSFVLIIFLSLLQGLTADTFLETDDSIPGQDESLRTYEVDIISSFHIDELMPKLPRVLRDFKINKAIPTDYFTKSPYEQSLKKILVFNPHFGDDLTIISTLPKEKLVFFMWEPNIFPLDYYDPYSYVYTWDDTLVDNVKFFRFNYPYLMPYRDSTLSFEEKKFLVMVASDWTQLRQSIVKFFDLYHPDALDVYGWNSPPGLKNQSIYKGRIPGHHSGDEKISTLQNYRFCICFENSPGLSGYITEKIFSCFAAGCIPIYLGPDNIEAYIPKSCFIDYRYFRTYEGLYRHLCSITPERYQKYLTAIKNFLQSEQAQIFSNEYFDNLIYEAITR